MPDNRKKITFPLKPRQWTHHHALRLFHLSLSACLVFAFLAAFIGQASVLSEVRAGEVTASDILNVTANVGQIQTGPGVITDSGGGIFNNPAIVSSTTLPILEVAPTLRVSIRPEMITSKKPLDPNFAEKDFIDVTNTQYPEFFGHTNINKAVIYLELNSGVLIRAAVYANENGDWVWKSTEPLRPGKNSLTAVAKNSEAPAVQARAVYDFFLELAGNAPAQVCNLPPESAQASGLFDVLVRVPNQFRSVMTGDDLIAAIELVSTLKDSIRREVLVEYSIENEQGETIFQSSETLPVVTQISLTKTFRLLPTVPAGKYRLVVKVPSQNALTSSADSFEVKGSPVLALGTGGRVDVTLVFQTIGLLILFFALIGYFEYNKLTILSDRIRRISEDDFRMYYKYK